VSPLQVCPALCETADIGTGNFVGLVNIDTSELIERSGESPSSRIPPSAVASNRGKACGKTEQPFHYSKLGNEQI
jgi:hypothetical protein